MVFERILVPLDGSPRAEQALAHAGFIARASGATVLLLRVLDTISSVLEHGPDSTEWRLRSVEAAHYLKKAARNPALQGTSVECHVAEGRPADQIVEFARASDADLIVLNAHGQGDASAFPFGGTAQKIAMTPGLSCLVLRDGARVDDTHDGYHKILVPLDGSRRSEWAVHVACSLATDPGEELILLHVVSMPEMPRRRPLTPEEQSLREQMVGCNRSVATDYLAELCHSQCTGRNANTRVVVSGRIGQAILDAASEEAVDLIVLATHEDDDEDVVSINTVWQYILQHAGRPVLVLDSVQHGSRGDPAPRQS